MGKFGKKMEILTPYGIKQKEAFVDAEFFHKALSKLKMSARNVLKLSTLMNEIPNLNVEPKLASTLQEKRHELSPFFEVREMTFYVHADEDNVDELNELELTGQISMPEDGMATLQRGQTYRLKRFVVICHDLPGLLNYLRLKRDLPWFKSYQLRLGLDGGQSKYCVFMINCLTPIIASKMKKKIFSLINTSLS